MWDDASVGRCITIGNKRSSSSAEDVTPTPTTWLLVKSDLFTFGSQNQFGTHHQL